MSKVYSRVALDKADLTTTGRDPIVEIALRQASAEATTTSDYLRKFPTEVRLMIFEELLIASKTIFRGASAFGPLHESEFDEEVPVSWQILATCRKYFEEAAPILYGKNKLVFCTGKAGEPGMFWRFPVSRRYMPYINDLGVFIRADDPKKEAARRVAYFLKALIRRATKLEHLTLLVASDRFYEALCPLDILLADHPVSKELLHLVEAETVKHLKIRLHDGACLAPHYAGFLTQTFMKKGSTGRSITFTSSCTCPPGDSVNPPNNCMMCGKPKSERALKPVESILPCPSLTEPSEERMMDMQDDLFFLGQWPGMDEDDGDEDEEYLVNSGPYKILARDVFEDLRRAFNSRLWYRDRDYVSQCFWCGTSERGTLAPGQDHRYLGEMKAPAVWYYRQTKLTEFFKYVEYKIYLQAVTAS